MLQKRWWDMTILTVFMAGEIQDVIVRGTQK